MASRRKTRKTIVRPSGRFAYDGLDRVIHEKARLGILTSLLTHTNGLSFNELKELCSLTDGNLSRHLAVLSDARLVKAWKDDQIPRPRTKYRLTPDGRRRFVEYVGVLETIVADAAGRASVNSADSTETTPGRISKGLSPA